MQATRPDCGTSCIKWKREIRLSRTIVTLNYKISLLDGTVCYSSANDGQKVFQVGKGALKAVWKKESDVKKGQQSNLYYATSCSWPVGDDDRIPSELSLSMIEVVNVGEK